MARLVLRGLFRRVLTVHTPMGRKARPKILSQGGPLIRVRPDDLARAGIQRVPRMTGVQHGKPVLANGRVPDPANIIWCTGFHPGFTWIELPAFRDGQRHTGAASPRTCPAATSSGSTSCMRSRLP